jgi:hypothetical protein
MEALWLSAQDETGIGLGGPLAQLHADIPHPMDHRFSAHPPRVPPSRLQVATHMARFSAAAAPRVAIVGDSTAAQKQHYGPTLVSPGLSPIDTLTEMLWQRLREDNPNKTITFGNYAVSGQTWMTLDGRATVDHPAFYSNPSSHWLYYPQSFNPDTLFINLGINEGWGISPFAVAAVLRKIAAWGNTPGWAPRTAYVPGNTVIDSHGRLQGCTKAGMSGSAPPRWEVSPATSPVSGTTTDGAVQWQLYTAEVYQQKTPDIVIITNKNACFPPPPDYNAPPFSLPEALLGTLSAASFQRNLALSNAAGLMIDGLPRLGLIDIGRYMSIVYNGFDPCEQSLSIRINHVDAPVVVAAAQINATYSLPETEGDFDLTIVMTSTDWNTGSTLGFSVGYPVGQHSNAPLYYSFLRLSTSGDTAHVVFSDGSGNIMTHTTAGVWPVTPTPLTLGLSARGPRVYLSLTDQWTGAITILFDRLVDRIAGPFTPQISASDGAVTAGIGLVYYAASTMRRYRKTLGAAEVFGGSWNGSVESGNGVNHASSSGLNAIDWAVLEGTVFVAP